MLKNMMPRENFPKIEEIREIENQIPTYEEFMKSYKGDDEIVKSYEDEFGSQAIQGPQYGPGKSDFGFLCREIKSELGSSLTCRVSCDSDYFYENSEYTGAMVYMVEGSARWSVPGGRACGRNGRAFYMIVKCTDGWQTNSSDYRYGIGGGIFHGYIIKDEFGHDLGISENKEKREKNIINCGGFAWMGKRSEKMVYNSYTLNSVDQRGYGGISDSKNELSPGEKKLVKYCFDEYKWRGPSSTFDIPSKYLP